MPAYNTTQAHDDATAGTAEVAVANATTNKRIVIGSLSCGYSDTPNAVVGYVQIILTDAPNTVQWKLPITEGGPAPMPAEERMFVGDPGVAYTVQLLTGGAGIVGYLNFRWSLE